MNTPEKNSPITRITTVKVCSVLFPVLYSKASFLGHDSTQLWQLMHSAEVTFLEFATSMFIGQLLLHNPQLMHLSSFLTIFEGLIFDIIPYTAPIGHRYLQKNLSYSMEPIRIIANKMVPAKYSDAKFVNPELI